MGIADTIGGIVRRATGATQLWHLTRRAIYGAAYERDGASPWGASSMPCLDRPAISLAAYAACIRVLSEDIGKLPVRVARRRDRRWEMLHDTALYDMLSRRPNPNMSAQAFREALMIDALAWGNGYAWIERDGAGRPVAMWPVDAARVRVMLDRRELRYNVAPVTPDDGIPRVLYRDEMLHIRNLGNGIIGYSVCQLAQPTIDLAMAAETFGTTFFMNGARAASVLTMPLGQKASDEALDRFRRDWQAMHGGAVNTNRMAILPPGWDIKPLMIPGDQAQFLETRQFQVVEICRWFRIPPHMIGSLERATFSNIEEQARGYVTEALMPWVRRWELELENKLLMPSERGVSIALELKGLLRGSHKDRAEYYAKLFQLGAITPNEIRELEDMEAVDGGDTPYVQLNLTSLGGANETADDNSSD